MPAKKKQDITYKSYLGLDELLQSQRPISMTAANAPAHDEMMFIVVHQTYELWFKLVLFEIERVQKILGQKSVKDADMRLVSASLGRSVAIMRLLVGQLDIMETMTPLDFLDFRHVFRSASGFQSLQFRELEMRLGLKNESRTGYNGKSYDDFLPAEDKAHLQKLQKKPSLLEQLDSWLARTPFVEMTGFSFWQAYRKAVGDMIAGDRKTIAADKRMNTAARDAEIGKLKGMEEQFALLFDEARAGEMPWCFSQKALQAALFINLYRDQPALQIPFRILNDLMDLDELLALWRYRHALMAQRMLGMKMGSGGSSGHDYLLQTIGKHRIFSDLFALSTFFIPRSKLPQLPPHVESRMGFRYWDDAGKKKA